MPPMSAVAARRAAAAAAAAAASANPSPAPTPPIAPSPPPPNPQPRVEPTSVDVESSSDANSDSDVQAALVGRHERPSKNRNDAKGKKKEVKQSRYFSGPTDAGSDNDDDDVMEEGAPVQMEALPEITAPKAAKVRRRRERTAFVDPECYSNVRLEETANAWQTTVSQEGGSTREGTVYALRVGEDVVIHGTFDLTLVSGSVNLLGATISAAATSSSTLELPKVSATNTHRVYSPASHPLPPIASVPSAVSSAGPSTLSLYLDAKIDISGFAAVVLVTSVETGIEGIEGPLKSGGLGCASGMFPPAQTPSVSGGKTWKLVTEPVPGLTMLRQLAPWSSAISTLVPSGEESSVDPGRTTVMVEGSKRVGKSTFSKMLLNKLLDRYEAVAYLDTDLGQPEFTTSGFVSLTVLRRPVFGPAFTHLTIPVAAHYLGSSSPASDPSTYVDAITSLLSTFALEVEFPLVDEPAPTHSRRRHHLHRDQPSASRAPIGKVRERVPLVINTQGWVKGLGADLLAKLKTAIQPTHVCSFVSVDDEGDYEGGAGAAFAQQQVDAEQGVSYHLYTLPAAPPNPLESKWAASDYRILSFVSYFHSTFAHEASTLPTPVSALQATWEFSIPLVGRVPFAIDWTASADEVSSVHLLDCDDIAYEHVLHALNGSLVAIVDEGSSSSSSSPASASEARAFPYDPLVAPPSPSTSKALGLAVVRAIVPSATTLELLTPVPPPDSRVALVKGSLEVPLALLLDHAASESERDAGIKGTTWRDVPFLTVEGGEGGGRRRVRRNLMRRGHA
ncbi:hypothetical protein JCM10212_006842 [Sporobolomyces blumeae]